MKNRLKGLIGLWVAVIMILGTSVSAIAAGGTLSQYVMYYFGSDDIERDYILSYSDYEGIFGLSYGDGSDNLSEQLSNQLDNHTPEGKELSGWNLWRANDSGCIYTDTPVTKAADGYLTEEDVENLDYYNRLVIEPVFDFKTFTVVWKNENGDVLETDEDVAYGTIPTYDDAQPTKAADAQYTYEFDGWDITLVAVTEDVTYTAKYLETLNKYTITFKDEDGTILQEEDVDYGEIPVYTGAEPTKAADVQYTYEFDGWDMTPVAVTEDATYTAKYLQTLNKYTITFKDEDGTILQEEDVDHGEIPVYTCEEPTKAADGVHTYTFAGWAPAIEEVTGDATYTATFTESSNTYTVVWKNYDGEVLETDENVAYGVTPEYNGLTPVKEATAEYTYTFAGWTPAVEEVTGDATYTATFTETTRTYTVTFDSNGGSDVDSVTVEYGLAIDKPKNPTRSGYNFNGWYLDDEFDNEYDFDSIVTEDFILYADWGKKKQNSGGGRGGSGGSGAFNFIVTFATDDGSTVESQTVSWPSLVKKPEDPTKEGYIFDGWYTDKSFENLYDFNQKVIKNITLYAKWRKTNVSDILNVREHFAYIKGYQDKVRPEDSITRAETVEIFFRLLNEEVRKNNLVSKNSFSDINPLEWYNTSVSTMSKLGIIKGRTTDIFEPDAFITRGEFAAICARFDNSDFEVKDTFTDIEGYWAENEILEATAHGWIKGYDDGTFRPDEFITRAEAITMINRMLGRTPETKDDLHSDMKKWKDNDENAWYYVAIQEASNDHSYEMKNQYHERWTSVK